MSIANCDCCLFLNVSNFFLSMQVMICWTNTTDRSRPQFSRSMLATESFVTLTWISGKTRYKPSLTLLWFPSSEMKDKGINLSLTEQIYLFGDDEKQQNKLLCK